MDTTRLTRRNTLALLAGGTVGGMLAACQAVGQPAAAPVPTSGGLAPAGPTAATTLQPRSGGTLRAGIQTDLPNTDPWFTSPSNYDALWVAFDRLIALDAQTGSVTVTATSPGTYYFTFEASTGGRAVTGVLRAARAVRSSSARRCRPTPILTFRWRAGFSIEPQGH